MIFYFFLFLAITASQGCRSHQPIGRYPHTSLMHWPGSYLTRWHDIWDYFDDFHHWPLIGHEDKWPLIGYDDWPLIGHDLLSPKLLTYQRKPACPHRNARGVGNHPGLELDDQSVELERQRLERIYRENVEKSKQVEAEMEAIKSQIDRLRQPSPEDNNQARPFRQEENRYTHIDDPQRKPEAVLNDEEPFPFQNKRCIHGSNQDVSGDGQDVTHESNVLHKGGKEMNDNMENKYRRQSNEQSINHEGRRPERSVNDHETYTHQTVDSLQNERDESNVHWKNHKKSDSQRREEYPSSTKSDKGGSKSTSERQSETDRSRNIPKSDKVRIPKSDNVGKIQDVMMIPMRGFQPRDLKISHHGDSIRVHASRTCKGKENCVSKEMDISYPLPYKIKPGAMKVSVDRSNILIRGIPLQTEVPIEQKQEVDESVEEDYIHSSISTHESQNIISRRTISDNFQENDSDAIVEEVED